MMMMAMRGDEDDVVSAQTCLFLCEARTSPPSAKKELRNNDVRLGAVRYQRFWTTRLPRV
jgi:hypothetical protein